MPLFKRPLFGGELAILTPGEEGDNPILGESLESAYRLGLALSKVFNFYDRSSELSRLNRERETEVSAELLSVMRLALGMCVKTGGKYDITLGKAILERKAGRAGVEPGCSYKDVSIGCDRVSLLHPDAMIDLGSVAKGYIADRIAGFLRDEGLDSFMIDARGDIIVWGEDAREIGIQHPRKGKGEMVGSVELKNLAVATSGDYSQFSGAFGKSHILNQADASSVTVVAKSLAEADLFSTALFVLGREERKNLLSANPQVKALVISGAGLERENHNGFAWREKS